MGGEGSLGVLGVRGVRVEKKERERRLGCGKERSSGGVMSGGDERRKPF